MKEKKVKYAFDNLIKKSKSRKCLLSNNECSGQAIQAHSIQNAVILEYLSEKDHVYTLRPNVENMVELKYTGRHVATTFSGLCSFHDIKIFSEIDFKTNSIPQKISQKQMTLFFLRAISIEHWKKQNTVNTFEELVPTLKAEDFDKASKLLGISEGEVKTAIKNPEVLEWSLLGEVKGLEDLEEFKGSLLWQINNGKLHGTINHYWKIDSRASVAVVSGCSPLWDTKMVSLYGKAIPGVDRRMAHMGITIFEVNGVTHVVISHLKKDVGIVGSLMVQINELAGNMPLFKKWLTEFVLENCENVVFRPSFIEGLTPDQKNELEAAARWSLRSGLAPRKDFTFCFFE